MTTDEKIKEVAKISALALCKIDQNTIMKQTRMINSKIVIII